MRTNETDAGLSQKRAIEATSLRRILPATVFSPRILAVTGLSVFHAALLGYLGWQFSPTVDEPAHLAAGVACWTLDRFDVYITNPPLVKMTAAAPVVLMRPDTDWKNLSSAALSHRTEWAVGDDFLLANVNRWRSMIAVARWMCIPFVLLGGTVCYLWAHALYGVRAGLLALCLWVTSPTVLAWGSTITPDVASAALGSLAGYWFWRWTENFTWERAALAGLAMGLAVLAKITWVILFALWPALFVLTCCVRRFRGAPGSDAGCDPDRRHSEVPLLLRVVQLGAICLIALYVVNTGYGWEGSFAPLRTYTFLSRPLAGKDALVEKSNGGNRFSGSFLEDLPVPLPKAFIQGADLQKYDFELTKRSFLNGTWKSGGWWYYYLEAILLKEPPGTWLLALLASGTILATFFRRDEYGPHQNAGGAANPHITGTRFQSQQRYWAGWNAEILLAMPAIVIFGLVSSETGFSRYLRYLLPIYPFLFIWISRCANLTTRRTRPGNVSAEMPSGRLGIRRHVGTLSGAVVCLGFSWNLVSSLCVYPHSMSYFTDCIGGPHNGLKYLGDANIGCGQDLHYLRQWYVTHPAARPLTVSLSSCIAPSLAGLDVDVRDPPAGPAVGDAIRHGIAGSAYGPQPGWYAFSVDMLQDPDHGYQYFRDDFEPIGRAGYSIFIYDISPEAAHAVRARIGLSPLVDREGLHRTGISRDPTP